MAERYLVTGGLGFIGSALTRALVRTGARVRVLDDASRGSLRRLEGLSDAVEIVDGDVRDPETVARACPGADAVCHLAYINGTRHFYERPADVLDVAVKGLVNVLDACRGVGVKRLYLASSSEVYNEPPAIPTDETAPLVIPDPHNPRFSYATGKILTEVMGIHYGRAYFDHVVLFRPHNVYGPDMGWEHVIPELVTRMVGLRGSSEDPAPFPIQGSGAETRAFMFVDDFVGALLRVIERGEHLGIYHIGTREEVRIDALATAVASVLGVSIRVVPGELKPGSTKRRCPDVSRLEALDFRPQVPLAEGLARTVRWYRDELAGQGRDSSGGVAQ